MRVKYIDIDFRRTQEEYQQNIVYRCSVGFLLALWCLVGVRERTLHKHHKARRKPTEHLYTMIVAASCGTKNNNASLQSNN